MDALLRVPHGFLRRHLSMVERGLVSAGLGLVVYGLLTSLPVYPSPWEIAVSVTIALVMLWSPPVGYFLAVIAALYPLYTVSLYLAVLFLAVAMLGQRVFIHNMGATLLVLVAPWLAQFHLEWMVVLLGGLWWGKNGGAWIGGMAALWGQLLFGMTGQPPNWLDMMGIAPAPQGLFAQFKDANSLETLKLIVAPLAPNPTQLLYLLLQIILWAMVAGLVGGIAETAWVQQKHPWRAIATTIFGAAGLALVNLGLAVWLEQYKAEDFTWIFPGMLESGLYAALAATALECTRDFVEHPLALMRQRGAPGEQILEPEEAAQALPRASIVARMIDRVRMLRLVPAGKAPAAAAQAESTSPAGSQPETNTSPYPPVPVPTNLPHKDGKKQRPDDIIKIELD
jgi:hypothetical protein